MAKKRVQPEIAERLRGMIRAAPFREFDIKTSDGDTFHAFHPEFVMVSPIGDTAMMFERDGHFRFLNLRQVVSIEPTRPKKGMLGSGGGKR